MNPEENQSSSPAAENQAPATPTPVEPSAKKSWWSKFKNLPKNTRILILAIPIIIVAGAVAVLYLNRDSKPASNITSQYVSNDDTTSKESNDLRDEDEQSTNNVPASDCSVAKEVDEKQSSEPYTTYTSTKYGYSFKYLSQWKVKRQIHNQCTGDYNLTVLDAEGRARLNIQSLYGKGCGGEIDESKLERTTIQIGDKSYEHNEFYCDMGKKEFDFYLIFDKPAMEELSMEIFLKEHETETRELLKGLGGFKEVKPSFVYEP